HHRHAAQPGRRTDHGPRLQACLQTSCCVVQLRLHGAVPAGLGVATGPTTTQEFWQFIATVSQVVRHAVVAAVCGSNCGAGAGSGVATVCASLSPPHAAEVPSAMSSVLSCRMRSMERLICSLGLYPTKARVLGTNKSSGRTRSAMMPWVTAWLMSSSSTLRFGAIP